MTWRLLLALIGLSTTGISSFAQRPPGAEGLDSSRSSPQDAGFFSGTGVVRFELIQGRLSLDPLQHRKGSQSVKEGDVYESITVTARRGIPSMHYVCQDPSQHLTLSVQDGDSVRIESWMPEREKRAVIQHAADGNVTWELTHDESQQTVSQPTLLHLRQHDPAAFDLHFGDLIKRLLQGQSLQSLCEQTHRAMLAETTRQTVSFTATDVERCVERLGAPRRQVRAQAEQQLLAWGTPIIPFLKTYSPAELDAEQTERVRYIRRRLRSGMRDTPSTLAKLLVNDTQYWSSIAQTLQADQRQSASDHLQRVGFTASFVSP